MAERLISSKEKVNFATCSNAWLLSFLTLMMLFHFLTIGLVSSSVSLHVQNVTSDSTLVDSTKTINLHEVVVSQKVVQNKANQLTNLSTHKLVSSQTHKLTTPSTHKLISSQTHQLTNSSTFWYVF